MDSQRHKGTGCANAKWLEARRAVRAVDGYRTMRRAADTRPDCKSIRTHVYTHVYARVYTHVYTHVHAPV